MGKAVPVINSHLIFIKTPLLPRQYALDLLAIKSHSELQKKLLLLFKEDLVKKAIATSSLIFFETLSQKIKENRPVDELISTLYSYIIRLSLRSTTFGIMSSVSIGTIHRDRMLDMSKRRLQLTSLGSIKENSGEHFLINPTLYKLGHKCFYNSWKDEGEIRNYSLKSFVADRKLLNILNFLEKPLNKLAVEKIIMLNFACNQAKASVYLRNLVSERIVLSSRDNKDLGPRKKNQKLFADLKLSDAQGIGKDSNVYDVILWDARENVTFDKKSSDKVFTAAQKLSDMFYGEFFHRSYHQFLEEFKRNYLKNYSDKSCSLLEVLDSNVAIGFLSGDDLVPPKSNEETLNFFNKKIYSDEIYQSGEWKLSNEDIVKLSSLAAKPLKPKKFKCTLKFIEFKEGHEKKWYLKSSPCGGSFEPFYRFNHLSENIKKKLNICFSEDFKDLEIIYAELEYYQSRRISSYKRKEYSTKYYIPITGFHSDPTKIEIKLEDIYITIINDEIILFSKKLNKRIIPLCLNNYIFHYDPLPAARLLYSVAKQTAPDFLRWIWPHDLFTKIYPRVSYKNVIYSPKRWIFGKEELLHSIDKPQFCSFYRLPEFLSIMDEDTFVAININNSELFKKIIKKQKSEKIILEETLEAKGLLNEFSSELAISCEIKPPNVSSSYTPSNKLTLRSENIFLGESDGYLNFNIKLHPELKYYCLNEICAFLSENKWFYIFYLKDNFYELRIRVFQLSQTELIQLKNTLLKCLQKLSESKAINTYYNELYESDESLLNKSDGKNLVSFYHHSTKYFTPVQGDEITVLFSKHMDYLRGLLNHLGIGFVYNVKYSNPEKAEQKKMKTTLIKSYINNMDNDIDDKKFSFPKIELVDPKQFSLRILHMNSFRIDAFYAPAIERASLELLNAMIRRND